MCRDLSRSPRSSLTHSHTHCRTSSQVNAQAAARILAEQAGLEVGEGDKKRKRKGGDGELPSLLEDDRFKAMFEDPEFAIDERSAEWKLLHPNTGAADARFGSAARRSTAAGGRLGWSRLPDFLNGASLQYFPCLSSVLCQSPHPPPPTHTPTPLSARRPSQGAQAAGGAL